ncbi:FHA domain-containing protein [Patulibacter defluvii]|uniref:FHA domain-containing protein n=1 Tax=Patulibacter defluvii TaxID=3095358 RepID=UPI002A7573B1|nr:FHA domain-containing protein [Patulibacter sp. DM4]
MEVRTGRPEDSTPVRLRAVILAEREGRPFLVAHDGDGAQRLYLLEPGDERLWIGRAASCDVVLDGDGRLSRQHAELVATGDAWAVLDDGLSRNGTWIDGQRVVGRRRLEDGDVLRLGSSTVVFRAPGGRADAERTVTALDAAAGPEVTPAQRRVLVALVRPLLDGDRDALPAGNGEIAAELVVSAEAVRSHLKALYAAFGLEDVPQAAKRLRLARAALQAAVVTPSDR